MTDFPVPSNIAEDLERLPFLLYADDEGRIYDHPYYRMAAASGAFPVVPAPEALAPMPEFSKLFFLPGCTPIGVDPETGAFVVVPRAETAGGWGRCHAVAAFPEPGWVRTHLPCTDYQNKSITLPMWAYTAVGFEGDGYRIAAFQVEVNPRWDPRNYDDRELVRAIRDFRRRGGSGRLVDHLENCATRNHCFAAKNLFLRRWEAPLPVSRRCNAACLGCLSLQPQGACEASHQRIRFTPDCRELVSLAVDHLKTAPWPIVSYGQGCEGEPLTEAALIADSVRGIRRHTDKGTINLNTNGSYPNAVRRITQNGLDSIRISLNSAQPEWYRSYYRPRDYDMADVVKTLANSRERGLYTMANYLVFPGISDQPPEVEALSELIGKTGLDFLHVKNLCIDPQLYLNHMPPAPGPGMGIERMISTLTRRFPTLQVGYFNQPVR